MNVENVSLEQEKVFLNPIYSKGFFSLFIFIVSISLAFVNAVLKSSYFIGFWDIVSFLLLLTPLVWMVIKKEIKNKYTIFFLPVIFVLIADIFIYNNSFTQGYLPRIIFVLILLLYFTSMQNTKFLYQVLIPHKAIPFKAISYMKLFVSNLFIYKGDKSTLNRIGLALVITLPFVSLFLALFMSADIKFNNFVTSIFQFDMPLDIDYIFTIPFYLVFFLLLFIFSFSNIKEREALINNKSFDSLIVSIFLSTLNVLFICFLLFQISYLFAGASYIKESGVNIAQFAREGFFQLMWVMGIVVTIFLLLMSRFKGEKSIGFLLMGLILSTIVIGLSSLKKMFLYQSLMGATVLRYYVQWFDYFLLLVLGLGIFFILKRIDFNKILDIVVVIGLVAFTIVSSINIDKMVASHNVEKFKNSPSKLDKKTISKLSVDVLPVIQNSDYIMFFQGTKLDLGFYKRDCSILSDYHYGYCKLINQYGENKLLIKPYENGVF